ncbi:MAG: GntR family transcriptional [Beijerinckiaceae bacterium]|nr:MAG: GntR family transcriptional [Beijerinckiaceae bacterium]
MKPASTMPLYEEIAHDLIGAIDAGVHPVGSLMPTELELVERYKVSRQTVRMAMQRLTEIGAVTRRAGSGTRVEARRQASGSFQWTLASLGDLTRLAAMTTRDVEIIEPVIMDKSAARNLGAAPGSRWMRLSYIRRPVTPGAKPLAWVDVYVEERYADVLLNLGDNPALVCDLIENRYGARVSEVRQEVSAVALEADHAKALKAEAGTPALKVLRRYYDQRSSLFEVTVSTHPAGRYSISSTLKRLA